MLLQVQANPSTSPRSTAELIQAAAAGDEEAWEALVDRYNGLVWAVIRAHRLHHHEAADVAQTTWLRLVQHLKHIRRPEAAGAWLATTARRESLRVLRRIDRECPTEDSRLDCPDAISHGPETQALAAEVDRVLHDCLDALPTHCQALLRALMSDPLPSYKEISDALDLPVGSIGPTRGRCLQCLRRIIERAQVTEDLRDVAR